MESFFRSCEHILFSGLEEELLSRSFREIVLWFLIGCDECWFGWFREWQCSNLVRGVACSLTLDAVPGDLDLYVYLNVEMAIVRLQWVSFAATPSRTSNPLNVVTVSSTLDVFCHSVVEVWLGCQVPCCSSLVCMLSIYCTVLFTFTNLW